MPNNQPCIARMIPLIALCLILPIGLAGCQSKPGPASRDSETPATTQIFVHVPFPGASAEDVERDVCIPLEDAVLEIEGIQQLRSIAVDGAGLLELRFQPPLPPDLADTRRSQILGLCRSAMLPAAVGSPTVRFEPIPLEPGDSSVSFVIVVEPGDSDMGEAKLMELANRLAARIHAVNTPPPGDAAHRYPRVDTGRDRPVIEITLDPERLARFGLTTEQVMRKCRDILTNVGQVTDDGARLQATGTDSREIEEQAIRTPTGARVRLSDLGHIRLKHAAGHPVIVRQDRQRPVQITVATADDADHQAIEQAIRGIAEKVSAEQNVTITVLLWAGP